MRMHTGPDTVIRRPTTLLVRMVVVSLLAVVGWFVPAQFAPAVAHAWCWGDFASTSNVGFAAEDARESCNDNGVYYGRIRDIREDGSCVYVRFRDGSYSGIQGVSCDSAGYNYAFWDQTGNTSAIAGLFNDHVSPRYLDIYGY